MEIKKKNMIFVPFLVLLGFGILIWRVDEVFGKNCSMNEKNNFSIDIDEVPTYFTQKQDKK
jgi:hypothetical protein